MDEGPELPKQTRKPRVYRAELLTLDGKVGAIKLNDVPEDRTIWDGYQFHGVPTGLLRRIHKDGSGKQSLKMVSPDGPNKSNVGDIVVYDPIGLHKYIESAPGKSYSDQLNHVGWNPIVDAIQQIENSIAGIAQRMLDENMKKSKR